MSEFKVGDWVYAHDWCYGQITDLTDDEATVEFETERGGGSFPFDITDLRKAPEPRTYSMRDSLLVIAGARAAYLDMDVTITVDLPDGLEGEDTLVKFVTQLVDYYLKHIDELNFDEFIESKIIAGFGEKGK